MQSIASSVNKRAWLTEDVKVSFKHIDNLMQLFLKVYITFVIIIILAGGIVFSKVCIYDWWWKAQEVLMNNCLLIFGFNFDLEGTKWGFRPSEAGPVQQHQIHWQWFHSSRFYRIPHKMEKDNRRVNRRNRERDTMCGNVFCLYIDIVKSIMYL